ncbi:MAG: hypothetical protein IKC59_01920 [Clostridia bacterium]|nr:hypothetical protein [Clostridia bacterium]
MKKKIRVLCLALSVLLVSASLVLMPVAENSPATAESTEVVLYEENFESYDSVSTYTELGWTSNFNGDKVAVSVGTLNGSKALKMDDADAWSSLRFVAASQMKGIKSYTVSMDLMLGDLTGIFGFIYNNAAEGNNQQNTGMIQFRKQDGVYYVANGGKKENSYYCASYEGEGGYSGWGGQWAPVSGYLNGQDLIGTAFRLELKIDNQERTCSLYIDGALVNTCENIVVNANGIDFLTQKQISYVDNIKVTVTYASAELGRVIYSNTFDAYTTEGTDNLLADLGWSNFFTNTNANFTSTSNGSVLCDPKGWSAAEIVTAEQMNGIQQYTVSMDMTIRDALGNPFGLITNWDAKNGTSWPRNCNFIQIRPGYNSDQTNDYVIRSGIYFAGSPKAFSDDDVSIGAKNDLLDQKMNFTVEMDLLSHTSRTYINGVLMDTYTNANFSVYNSGVCLLAQSGSVEIDNLYVTEGLLMSEIAMTAEGHQRTVAADSAYGLRFISSIKAVENVKNICIKVEAAVENGDTKTFDFPGNKIYTSVTGMENGTETTYYASAYDASYLYCLVIKDIPVSLGTVTYTATPYVTLESGQIVCFAPISFTYAGAVLQA